MAGLLMAAGCSRNRPPAVEDVEAFYRMISEDKSPNILEYLEGRSGEKLHLAINIPTAFTKQELDDEYVIRRKAADYSIPLITNLQLARLLAEAITSVKMEELEVKAWDEYT